MLTPVSSFLTDPESVEEDDDRPEENCVDQSNDAEKQRDLEQWERVTNCKGSSILYGSVQESINQPRDREIEIWSNHTANTADNVSLPFRLLFRNIKLR